MLDVVKYLFERLRDKRDPFVTVGEQPYAIEADGTIGDAIRPLVPELPDPLICSTLAGLHDAYASGVDCLDREKVAFHIVNHCRVDLVSIYADEFGRRRVYAVARHDAETPFAFDSYIAPEAFRISFQASFYLTEEATKVLRLISQLGTKGEEVNISDDGISQTVEIKSGTVMRGKVDLPSDGVPLVPWRTFRDAAPVTSRFLLRLKTDAGVPKVALHEIDAKWKLDTVASIRNWIREREPKARVIG